MTATTLTGPSAAGTTLTDGASIDAIIAAFYEIVSGPAGVPRDWARARKLFVPGACLVAGTPMPNGEVAFEVLDVEGYAASRTPYFAEHSFYETEVERRVDHCGPVAHVFSRYESRTDPSAPPFMGGVNAIQVLQAHGRWWIVSAAWQHDSAGTLPDFLSSGVGARTLRLER